MKKRILPIIIVISTVILTACGSTSHGDAFDAALDTSSYGGAFESAADTSSIGWDLTSKESNAEPAAEAYSNDYAYEREDYGTDYSSEADAVKNNMMVAREARLSVNVDNLEKFDSSLKPKVEELGGYFTSSTVNNYPNEWSTSRCAYYTFKIPAEKLDSFLNKLEGETEITERTVTAEDVSLRYVDNEAKIKSLKTEKENLLRLMDNTTEVSDIIEIENRLSDVQYELDSAEQQKRVLEGRVNYSEVDLTACEERNVEHPIRKAFEINFKGRMLEGLKYAVTIFVILITAIPTIIIVTAFILLFIWLLRLILKKIFKRKSGTHYVLMPVRIEEPEKAPKTDVQNKADSAPKEEPKEE